MITYYMLSIILFHSLNNTKINLISKRRKRNTRRKGDMNKVTVAEMGLEHGPGSL